jgi:hypothetical protein
MQRFFNVLTKAHHRTLSWARWIQSISSNRITLTQILILFCHLSLGLFNSDSQWKRRNSHQFFSHVNANVSHLSNLPRYEYIHPNTVTRKILITKHLIRQSMVLTALITYLMWNLWTWQFVVSVIVLFEKHWCIQHEMFTLLQRVRHYGSDSERHFGADSVTTYDSCCHTCVPETHPTGCQQPSDILTGWLVAIYLHTCVLPVWNLLHRARHTQEQRALNSNYSATGMYVCMYV